MSLLDNLKITVAPPFQVNSCTHVVNGKKQNVIYYPLLSVVKPFTIPDRTISYNDFNGWNDVECKKLVKTCSLRDMIQGIKTNEHLKKTCSFLRNPSVSKEDKFHVKMSRLYRMYPAGFDLNKENGFKFTKENISEYIGLLCFDADNLDPFALNLVIDFIQKDEHTLMGFLSPRGNGYKWLVRVPALKDKHELYYSALVDYYHAMFLGSIKLDTSCININRTIFASYDPDCYVNEEAKIWYKYTEPVVIEKEKKEFHSSVKRTFEIAVERVESGKRKNIDKEPLTFTDGNRHDYIVALAGMCKEFGMAEDEFLNMASDYIKHDKSEFERVVSSIYKIKNK